ncbi:MAG: putative ABC transport system permease protein [Candidatus Azotimanducaceae bacterium]|jgi:putative ABC transport system permease protein
MQFLAESAGVAITGGVFGIAVGVIAGLVIKSATGWQVQLDAWVGAGVLIFSLSVGMLVGLYPAYRASKLDPIEAIRCE